MNSSNTFNAANKTWAKAEDVALTKDIWNFIKGYFNLLYDDVVRISFEFKAGEFGKVHSIFIERTNDNEVIDLPYFGSDEFVRKILEEFRIDWTSVCSFKFSIDSETVPVFEIGKYPLLKKQ